MVPTSFGMTPSFSKQVCNKPLESHRSEWQACCGANHKVGLCAPHGAAHHPGQVHRKTEGNHPQPKPASSSSQRAARHSGLSVQVETIAFLTMLPPLHATTGHTGCDPLCLAGAWCGLYTCPCPLSGRHMAPGSIKQGIFFLALDKSTFIFPYVYVCTQTDTYAHILECKAPARWDDGSKDELDKTKVDRSKHR